MDNLLRLFFESEEVRNLLRRRFAPAPVNRVWKRVRVESYAFLEFSLNRNPSEVENLYVITFYSFKGGVGRTMALVNVAAELVRRDFAGFLWSISTSRRPDWKPTNGCNR